MKKRILPLLLALALLLGMLPAAQAASPVYFPEFAAATGCGMTPDMEWPAADSTLVPTQKYFSSSAISVDDCLGYARTYISILEGTGDFIVVSPLRVVTGREGSDSVGYSANLRYTGSAAMKGTLKAMRASGQWGDEGEYHITVLVDHEGSRPRAERQNSVTVRWDSALRPEGIDGVKDQTPADQTPESSAPAASSPPSQAASPVAGLADNQFPDFHSAMGYYLTKHGEGSGAQYEDEGKDPASYEELQQFAQEYVDLLVKTGIFTVVSTFDANHHGGSKTCYLRYTGTAEMQESMRFDYIPWFHYSPYHLTVKVTEYNNSRWISVAWDDGLEAVDTELRTPSGERLGRERPSLTAVLAIGYPMMAVGDEVVPVDDLSVEVYPIVSGGRTLVPVSRILAALGGESSWDGATRTATFRLGKSTVVVPIGSTQITVNGASRTIDTAARIYHGRTYAPLRAVLEGLGLWVGYEHTYHLVIVSTDDLSQTEDLVELGESQRLFASELIPETPTKIVERYAIDDWNYTMEVGEALTLFNPRSAISGYSAYGWDVLDGGELVHLDPLEATCRFYAKRPGVVTVRAYLDETIVNYFGGSTTNTYTYTMTITILPATGTGSSGGLMKYKPCPSCKGSGKIQVGTRQETCPTCLGRKFVLQ